MKTKTIQPYIVAALCATAVPGYGGDAPGPNSSSAEVSPAMQELLDYAARVEGRDAAQPQVRTTAKPASQGVVAVFDKAKAAADDGSVDFFGFYPGMDRADLDALVAYYGLKEGEWAAEGDPVHDIQFTLKGVRRVTRGGNTYDELEEAVANRVGDLRYNTKPGLPTMWREYKTIDGVLVTMSEAAVPSEGIPAGLRLADGFAEVERMEKNLVARRAQATRELDAVLSMGRKIRSASGFDGVILAASYAKELGVDFDADDPYGSGERLGQRLKELEKEWRGKLEGADRELARLRDAYPEVYKERDAAEQKAREEAQKARGESSAVARPFRTEAKTISISDAVAIELQSVPGGLWFGKTEVTQAQWEAVMGAPCPISKYVYPQLIGSDFPAVKVSWDDCQEFLRKLNALPVVKESGLVFRLPTEEEWENACRSGSEGKYCLLADGTEITEETIGRVAWFKDNSEGKMHSVGQKEPNAWGLYDMFGNVLEWTSTAETSTVGEVRIYRSQSVDSPADFCVFSFREGIPPNRGSTSIGFRLCAEAAAK